MPLYWLLFSCIAGLSTAVHMQFSPSEGRQPGSGPNEMHTAVKRGGSNGRTGRVGLSSSALAHCGRFGNHDSAFLSEDYLKRSRKDGSAPLPEDRLKLPGKGGSASPFETFYELSGKDGSASLLEDRSKLLDEDDLTFSSEDHSKLADCEQIYSLSEDNHSQSAQDRFSPSSRGVSVMVPVAVSVFDLPYYSSDASCTDSGLIFDQASDAENGMGGWGCYNRNNGIPHGGCHTHGNYNGHSSTFHIHGCCHCGVGTQGGIRQTFSTSSGTSYKLKFQCYAGTWDGGSDTDYLEVSTDGGSSWTQYGCAPGAWQDIEHPFTASGSTDFIIWADGYECIDVDNILLEACASASASSSSSPSPPSPVGSSARPDQDSPTPPAEAPMTPVAQYGHLRCAAPIPRNRPDLGCDGLQGASNFVSTYLSDFSFGSEWAWVNATLTPLINGLQGLDLGYLPSFLPFAFPNICLGTYTGKEIAVVANYSGLKYCAKLPIISTLWYSVLEISVPLRLLGFFCSTTPKDWGTALRLCLVYMECGGTPTFIVWFGEHVIKCFVSAFSSGAGGLTSMMSGFSLKDITFGISPSANIQQGITLFATSLDPRDDFHFFRNTPILGHIYLGVSFTVDAPPPGPTKLAAAASGFSRKLSGLCGGSFNPTFLTFTISGFILIDLPTPRLDSLTKNDDVGIILSALTNFQIGAKANFSVTVKWSQLTRGAFPDMSFPDFASISMLLSVKSDVAWASGFYITAFAGHIILDILLGLVTAVLSAFENIVNKIFGGLIPGGIHPSEWFKSAISPDQGNTTVIALAADAKLTGFLLHFDLSEWLGTLEIQCFLEYTGFKFSCKFNYKEPKWMAALLEAALWVLREVAKFFSAIGSVICAVAASIFNGLAAAGAWTQRAIQDAVAGVADGVILASKEIARVVSAVAGAVEDAIKDVSEATGKVVGAVLNGIEKGGKALGNAIVEATRKTGNAIVKGIVGGAKAIGKGFNDGAKWISRIVGGIFR